MAELARGDAGELVVGAVPSVSAYVLPEVIARLAAAHPGVDFPAPHNIFESYDIQWLTFTSGVTPNPKLFGEQSYWIEKYRERYLGHVPFR